MLSLQLKDRGISSTYRFLGPPHFLPLDELRVLWSEAQLFGIKILSMRSALSVFDTFISIIVLPFSVLHFTLICHSYMYVTKYSTRDRRSCNSLIVAGAIEATHILADFQFD